ncbi:MAG: FAD:protein FMN transferase [Bryobacterales bacterium]|nr:FAD:protein FMN transferase [Bryobacterales bacterium]
MAWLRSNVLFTALPALLTTASFAGGLPRQEAVEPHMGTLVRLVFHARDATPARAAFDRIAALDRALSDYSPDSSLNHLCRAQSATLTGDLAAIIPQALSIARETKGAYDPTLAALTRHMPHPPALHGYRNVTLNGLDITLNGVCFDLGGIAKGYAAREAVRALAAQGVRRAMAAVSGDICVSGGPWRVSAQGRVVQLRDACISTSGNEAQPGHIFDPRTGERVRREGQVTAIARDGARADALATAYFVTSPGGGWFDERQALRPPSSAAPTRPGTPSRVR